MPKSITATVFVLLAMTQLATSQCMEYSATEHSIANIALSELETQLSHTAGLMPNRVGWTDGGPADQSFALMAFVAAQKLGMRTEAETVSRLDTMLSALERTEKYQGLFYWYYVNDLRRTGGSSKLNFLDNVGLAAAFELIAQAYPTFSTRALALESAMNFSVFYDPVTQHYAGEYDTSTGLRSAWETDYRYDCTRIGLLAKHSNIDRNLVFYDLDDHLVRTPGGISYYGQWDDSGFCVMFPSLFLGNGSIFSGNERSYVAAQIEYANSKGYPFAGVSECILPDNSFDPNTGLPWSIGGKDVGAPCVPAAFTFILYSDDNYQKLLDAIESRGLLTQHGLYDSFWNSTGETPDDIATKTQAAALVALAERYCGAFSTMAKAGAPELFSGALPTATTQPTTPPAISPTAGPTSPPVTTSIPTVPPTITPAPTPGPSGALAGMGTIELIGGVTAVILIIAAVWLVLLPRIKKQKATGGIKAELAKLRRERLLVDQMYFKRQIDFEMHKKMTQDIQTKIVRLEAESKGGAK